MCTCWVNTLCSPRGNRVERTCFNSPLGLAVNVHTGSNLIPGLSQPEVVPYQARAKSGAWIAEGSQALPKVIDPMEFMFVDPYGCLREVDQNTVYAGFILRRGDGIA